MFTANTRGKTKGSPRCITRFLCEICLCLAMVFSLLNTALCQHQEKQRNTITITTYYPAPLGAYKDLRAQSLAVGDTNKDGNLDSNDMPANAGELYVAKNIYVNLGEHKMMMGFENLGEDMRYSCKEGPNAAFLDEPDTCNGDKIMAYACLPDEERTCNDIYSAIKDICTGKILYIKKPNAAKVVCRARAVWIKQ